LKQPVFNDTWPNELSALADAVDNPLPCGKFPQGDYDGSAPCRNFDKVGHNDIHDSLDSLIDSIPVETAPAPRGQVLEFGTTAGHSLKALVRHVQQNFPDTRHDTKKLLLQLWRAQGAVIPQTLETFILRHCTPPEAVTRTARPYYHARQQATR